MNIKIFNVGARLLGATLLTGALVNPQFLMAQAMHAAPVETPAGGGLTDDQRIDLLEQRLEDIQKELLALRKARGAGQPAAAAQPPTAAAQPAQPSVVAHTVVPSSASSSSSAAPGTSVATTTPAQATSDPKAPHSEPFAFADFTWLTGNARTKDTPYATEFFTPEIRVDANYTYDFRHPKDDTISGSSEVFRANEVQLTQLGVGGDFHYDNVRARLMTQFGLYSQTTPRNDASPARGQWNLDNAYRYVSEAYGGYHFNVQHGINVDAGIFMSYVGLFSYYQFDVLPIR